MRAIFFCIVFLSSMDLCGQNQGVNNHWILGYSSFGGLPFGNPRIDFYSGVPIISYDSLEMNFCSTHSNISDNNGNILFYTNGVYIADATNDTMQSGSGLNPGSYSSAADDGMNIPQSTVIIKKPGSGNIFYVFHSSWDNHPNNSPIARNLYLTTIDMNLNNGLGSVTQKNIVLIFDSLNCGKLSMIRHANGRDWWLFVHRVNSNKFYKLLITPVGISSITTQNIGIVRNWDVGQSYFSPDGTRYAYFYINGGLEIFDFDRCTGLLSNPTYIPIAYDGGFNVGIAFSPNSNILYVSNVHHILQFDLTSTNIAGSMDTVATYDGYLCSYPPWPPLPTVFGYCSLTPDGKIYITSGNSTLNYHIILNPDILGDSCNVNQHGVYLPAFYYNTLPNHPNYFLGKIPGSPCDTINATGVEEIESVNISIYPNPSQGNFTLQFPVQEEPGILEVVDNLGRKVFSDYIAPWSQFKKIELPNLQKGIYLCRMKWVELFGSSKIIVE